MKTNIKVCRQCYLGDYVTATYEGTVVALQMYLDCPDDDVTGQIYLTDEMIGKLFVFCQEIGFIK